MVRVRSAYQGEGQYGSLPPGTLPADGPWDAPAPMQAALRPDPSAGKALRDGKTGSLSPALSKARAEMVPVEQLPWVPPRYASDRQTEDKWIQGVALGGIGGTISMAASVGASTNAQVSVGIVGGGLVLTTTLVLGIKYLAPVVIDGLSYRRHVRETAGLTDLEAGRMTFAPLDTHTQIAPGTTQWHADQQDLRALPVFPASIRQVQVRHNQLDGLHPESFRAHIESRHLSTAKPLRLDLSHNRFTKVPRFLLDFHQNSTINLRENPLPMGEISAVERECLARLRQGKGVPYFIFDVIRDTNVHDRSVIGLFTHQIQDLEHAFPEIAACKSGLDYAALAERLDGRLVSYAADDPALTLAPAGEVSVLQKAQEAVRIMCDHSQLGVRTMDYHQTTPGYVLALVERAIDAQDDPALRVRGLDNLIRHLSYAHGFCSTRHVSEALNALRAAYPKDGPPQMICLPTEMARDIMTDVSKKILRGLTPQPGAPLPSKRAFRNQFENELWQKHPEITARQRQTYIQDFALPYWDDLSELAREDTPLLPSGR